MDEPAAADSGAPPPDAASLDPEGAAPLPPVPQPNRVGVRGYQHSAWGINDHLE